MEHSSDEHKGRNNKIRVTNTSCIITRMKKHMKATQISKEVYLRMEMLKANRPQLGHTHN